MPHGPAHAVRSSDVWISFGFWDGACVVCGRPENGRLGSGCCCGSIFGEWQSLQAPIVIRYLPRAIFAASADCAVALAAAKRTPIPSAPVRTAVLMSKASSRVEEY